MSKFHLLFLLALVQPLPGQTATIRGSVGTASADATVTVVVDSDRDGLTDAQEAIYRTDPNKPDTDGDGLTDKAEVDALTDPLINQFKSEPDWSFMPALVRDKTRAFWDFETFASDTKTFATRVGSHDATAKPSAQADAVQNTTDGMLGKSAMVGTVNSVPRYLEINPQNLWGSYKEWNISFSAKFASEPEQSTVTPLISVYTANNGSINVPPILQVSLVNGISAENPSKSGLMLRLHGTGGLYGEWLLPPDIHLSKWNNFSFNSDGTYILNSRWCMVNGAKLDFIPVGIGYAALTPGPAANYGYILVGATKTSGGVLSISSIGIAMDRLAITSPLTLDEMTALDSRDTDGDGDTDRSELASGTDPCHYDTDNDDDRDGLANKEETAGWAKFNGVLKFFGSTKKNSYDSDGDLFDDYWEAKYFKLGFVDPNDASLPAINADYDNDGLSNWDEFVNGTSPVAVDSNGDGVIDPSEVSASMDTDGDGISDKDEVAYGSSPLDATEKPLRPVDFYGEENPGSLYPIGDLGAPMTAPPGADGSPIVVVQVGDPSESNSERWRLRVGAKQVVSEVFGELSSMTPLTLSTRDFHEITLEHVATKSGETTDYDYWATVVPKHGAPFILSDLDGLLNPPAGNPATDYFEQENYPSNPDSYWRDKKAYLVPLSNFSWSTSYSGGDAVGPKYRKVALNGRPMPDEKPQQEAESDLPDEETFIDAFNLSLNHDTTFAYAPLGSSDLVLQASASSTEAGFSDRSGLRPNERFDLPFGIGWSSNLCSYVEVVETIGDESNDPVTVNVIDEAGRPQRFGTRDFQSFFPWPSTRVDKKTYLNTLVRNGTNFTLSKKFGNTLTYTKSKIWFLYSTDRVEGSTKVRKHTYWRLAEARDRYGVRLQYDYDTQPGVPNDFALIPRKISSPDREGQFLVIERSPDSRRVESITDSRGNVTEYKYGDGQMIDTQTGSPLVFNGVDFNNAPFSHQLIAPRLLKVIYADHTTTKYSYDGGVEEERDTTDPENPRTTYHYHANLQSVTDKRGNIHAFHYAYDTSKHYWDSNIHGSRCAIKLNRLPANVKEDVLAQLAQMNDEGHGTWKTMFGQSRKIKSVDLPGGIGSSIFNCQGQMQFGASVGFTTAPSTTVTDAEGHLTIYDFTNMLAEVVDVDSTATSVSKEWMVYYLTSTIHHGGTPGAAGYFGTETYQFDPASGLSLWRATDLSGNATTWEFDDGQGGNNYTNAGIRNSLTNAQMMSKWPDPIAKFDALNRRETYSYNGAFRVMDGTDDPYDTTTTFTVDGLGRRTAKNVLQGGNASLSQERYDYGNQRFKAFQTAKTTVAFANPSGQAWETDLVTAYLPDTNGRLWRESVDPQGEKITTEHSYDFNNNRTSTLDARGNRTRFNYDKLNRLVLTTFPSAGTRGGEAVATKQFWYDLNGNKAAEIDEEGHYTIHHYDSLNRRIETIRDLDGLGLPGRNADDLVTEATKGTATGPDLVTRRRFNKVNAVTHSIDPRGLVTRTFYDAIQRPVHVFSGFSEAESDLGDGQGSELPSAAERQDARIDWFAGQAGSSTEKTHTEFLYTNSDPNVNFPSGVELKGNPGGTAFNSSGFKPTEMIRHGAVLTANGTIDLHTYAAYDALYRPLRTETQYQSGAYAVATTTYGTIAVGKEALLTTSADDRGKQTRTVMDGLQRPLSVTDAFGTALPANKQTVYASTGLVWKTIDPLNRETETEYDRTGRAVTVWQPDPVSGIVNRASTNDPLSGSPSNRTAYDKNNNVTVALNPLGFRWEYEYDTRNRKTVERQPSVTATEIVNGQPVETPFKNPVIHSTFDGVGNVIAVTDARDHVTRTFHDFAYRVTDILSNPVSGNPAADPQNPGANDILVHTTLDAGGNALAVTDGNGNATRNTYDTLNRLLTTATNPVTGQPSADPSNPAANDITVTNGYDDSNNLVQVTDGEGHVTGFRYDGLKRKTRTIWDEGSAVQRVEQSAYDGLVQLTRTDPKNQVTSYEYDALNRLEKVIYGEVHPDNRHYENDPVGNLLAVSYPNETAGRKTLRGVSQVFDKLNRLKEETSAGATHLYTNDKAGNRRTTTYSVTGRFLSSSYDKLNRLLSCTEKPNAASTTESLTSYAYDLAGNVTRKVLPNGMATQSTFDALNRKLTESTRTTADGQISSFDYSIPTAGYPSGHDNVGNLLQIAEFYGRADVKARNVINTYDRAHRLATETTVEVGGSTVATAYEYDKANNRTGKTVTGGSNPGTETSVYGQLADFYNSNQLKSVTKGAMVTTFQYDSNGNRNAKLVGVVTVQTYDYDIENRLVSLTDTTKGSFAYAYDHRTRRVGRDEQGGAGVPPAFSEISFSGGLSVQEYTSGSDTPNSETIRGSDYGGGIGGVLYTIRSGARSYNAYNSRGDVVSQTDDTAAITWQSTYEAFGTRTQEQGVTADHQKANTKDEDPTRLLNEGMRYRDLEFGVFLTRDPAGFVDGPNVYTYVNQNPWTKFDPEGLWMQPVGDWLAAKFGAPPAPVAFMARHSDKVTGSVHAINAGVSFVPGLGKLADGLDATISSAEGDYKGAALTAGGGKAAHLASSAMHATAGLLLAAKIVSHGDDVANVAKATEKTAGIATDLSKSSRTIAEEGAEAARRSPRDIAVSPSAPDALPLTRPIGSSPTQSARAQRHAEKLEAAGAQDVRINQQQLNGAGERVGINRPDLSYTRPRTGQRVNVEYERSGSTRGEGHRQRIQANDPDAKVRVYNNSN